MKVIKIVIINKFNCKNIFSSAHEFIIPTPRVSFFKILDLIQI